LPASAASDDSDALALDAAPEPAAKGPDKGLRMYLEGAVGRIAQRYDQPDLNARRLSLDLTWSIRLSDRWRFAFSDRLDEIHPTDGDTPSTLNSLREVYGSWQDEAGQHIGELGRINLRNGPSYGFNPTDYFRDNALRAVTTADPFALRENRLGVVVARYQSLWTGGGLSLALAPKLADAPSDSSFSADLGATNNRNRGVATLSAQVSDRLSGQVLAYADQEKGMQLGGSMTALLSDAMVGHLEFSRGKDDDLFSQIVLGTPRQVIRNRLSAGATYTTSTRLALTAEYEYNGFAPDKAAWDAGNAAGLPVYGSYLQAVQAQQDIASRTAWLLYANQKSVFTKSLDLTALLRINAEDKSRMGWLELRYHWPQFDAALQWQATSGQPASEYGLLPYSRFVQILGAWYF
jgi:hypothetical protein